MRSPYAVPVVAADPDAAEPWLATAFVPGPSLARAVTDHGPLPGRGVRALGHALARALAAVHATGLVHRDVKPGNVLLAVDGPRLIDFGIARTAEDTALTATGMVVGTPGFLAPEQAEGRDAETGPASDVFALGGLLAYAATGRPPFGTGAADALLYRTVHDEPDLVGVEGDLADLLRACLAKEPGARPGTGDVAAALAEGAPGEAPGAGTEWLPEPVLRDIAERSARMLALPDIEGTWAEGAGPASGPGRARGSGPAGARGPGAERAAGAEGAGEAGGARGAGRPEGAAAAEGAPGPEGAWEPPAVPAGRAATASRRRFLALGSAGVVLAAGGGTAAWLGLRGDGGGSGAGARGPRWRIGVQADLSGPQKTVGVQQERGARLAVEHFNARDDRPFTLELRTADDAGDTARATAAARTLTEDRAVLAVLGSTSDYTTDEALARYDETVLPLLTVSAGLNILTRGENRSFLRTCPSHPENGLRIAFHLQQHTKSVRAGLLHDRTDDNYAWQYSAILNRTLRTFGHRPYPRVVPARVDDYGAVVADMLRAGIDAFVHCGPADSAAAAARALAAAGFRGPRYGGQHVLDERFLKEAGDAAEGWIIAAPVADPLAVPTARKFAAAYRKRYGERPGYYAGESYDCVTLMIREITKAARGTRRPARKDLAAALRKASHKGVMGSYRFRPKDGALALMGTYMHQVRDGRFHYLGPGPREVPGPRKT
ncbi:bifunctional serine/threonine-protein kinase/ABC transporter substrate-binding protein [Streptomyces sp. PmtG]